MQKTTKKFLMFISVIIVAIMFVIGNVGYNNGSPLHKHKTAVVGKHFIVSGNSNAIVEKYSKRITVITTNSLDSIGISKALSAMQSNGKIDSSDDFGNQIDIIVGNSTVEQIYNRLRNISNTISVNVTMYIKLPTRLLLFYSGSKVRVFIPNKTFVIPENRVYKIGTRLNVYLQAIVDENGLLYNNRLRIIKIS